MSIFGAKSSMATKNEEPSGTINTKNILHEKVVCYSNSVCAKVGTKTMGTSMLHEFDEMNLTDIAALLRIPRGTVASRLRRARAEFRKHVAAIELAWDLGARGAARDDKPAPPRREEISTLGRALLRTGSSVITPMVTHARTLAALGLPGR